MNVNQQKNLQKIMLAFDKDYRLSEQLYDRQVELIESIRLHQLSSTFDVVTGKGVRQEVLEAAKDSPEFEELMDAYRREAMAIIARWDLADELERRKWVEVTRSAIYFHDGTRSNKQNEYKVKL